MSTKKKSPIVGLVFGLVGLVALGVTGWMTYNTAEFVGNARSVTGVVTYVEVNSDSDGNTYRPTFRFIDENGDKLRASTSWSSSSYNYNVGQRVEILYDVRNPERIRINSWFSIWGIALIPAFFGTVFLIVSMSGRRSRRKQERLYDKVEREIRTTTKYASQPSRETAEEHARETISQPTVRRRR